MHTLITITIQQFHTTWFSADKTSNNNINPCIRSQLSNNEWRNHPASFLPPPSVTLYVVRPPRKPPKTSVGVWVAALGQSVFKFFLFAKAFCKRMILQYTVRDKHWHACPQTHASAHVHTRRPKAHFIDIFLPVGIQLKLKWYWVDYFRA